jgi:hypothetical protein
METKNPTDLLRRVLKYCYYTNIISCSPEGQYENDDDVVLKSSFVSLTGANIDKYLRGDSFYRI